MYTTYLISDGHDASIHEELNPHDAAANYARTFDFNGTTGTVRATINIPRPDWYEGHEQIATFTFDHTGAVLSYKGV